MGCKGKNKRRIREIENLLDGYASVQAIRTTKKLKQYRGKYFSRYNQEIQIQLNQCKNAKQEIQTLWDAVSSAIANSSEVAINHHIVLARQATPGVLGDIARKITSKQVANLIQFGHVNALKPVLDLCLAHRNPIWQRPQAYTYALTQALSYEHITLLKYLHTNHPCVIAANDEILNTHAHKYFGQNFAQCLSIESADDVQELAINPVDEQDRDDAVSVDSQATTVSVFKQSMFNGAIPDHWEAHLDSAP